MRLTLKAILLLLGSISAFAAFILFSTNWEPASEQYRACAAACAFAGVSIWMFREAGVKAGC
jgi:hypothetical protein